MKGKLQGSLSKSPLGNNNNSLESPNEKLIRSNLASSDIEEEMYTIKTQLFILMKIIRE